MIIIKRENTALKQSKLPFMPIPSKPFVIAPISTYGMMMAGSIQECPKRRVSIGVLNPL